MHSVRIRRVTKKMGRYARKLEAFSIVLNGKEIADMISSWSISCEAGKMPHLRLELPLSDIDVYLEECEVSE